MVGAESLRIGGPYLVQTRRSEVPEAPPMFGGGVGRDTQGDTDAARRLRCVRVQERGQHVSACNVDRMAEQHARNEPDEGLVEGR
jgi:hypothetical protein